MHHHWVFFPFCGIFFILLLVGLLVANIVSWRRNRWRGYSSSHTNTPELILDKRLASGEITIDEYRALKAALLERK